MNTSTASTSFLWKLTLEPIIDWSDFVNAWSRLYAYPDFNEYSRLVQKAQITTDDIKWLFKWKNGMNLSQAKKQRIDEYILPNHLFSELEQLKRDFSRAKFEQHFSEISAIRQVFLLHILQPDMFPIFDQHVYRAYRYLITGQSTELPVGRAKRMNLYHKNYLPFFNQIALTTAVNRQTIDQALWAFGKFMKQYPRFTKHE